MSDELEDLLNNYKTPLEPKKSPLPKRPGTDKVSFHANKSGVDEKLVRSILGQESGGNPKAQSWAGNKGLLQVSQDVVNRFVKPTEFGTLDPTNEDVNLAAGTRYFKWLLDRYNGDIKRALAGYNAGEGRADRTDWWEQSLKWSNLLEVQKGLKPRTYRGSTREYIDKISSKYGLSGSTAPPTIDNLIDNYSSDEPGSIDDLLANYAEDKKTTLPAPTVPNTQTVSTDDAINNISDVERQLIKDSGDQTLSPQMRKQATDALARLRSNPVIPNLPQIEQSPVPTVPAQTTGTPVDIPAPPKAEFAPEIRFKTAGGIESVYKRAEDQEDATGGVRYFDELNVPYIVKADGTAKPEHPEKLPLMIETNGEKFLQMSNQDGLQFGETRVRALGNDKGGVMIATKGSDGKYSLRPEGAPMQKPTVKPVAMRPSPPKIVAPESQPPTATENQPAENPPVIEQTTDNRAADAPQSDASQPLSTSVNLRQKPTNQTEREFVVNSVAEQIAAKYGLNPLDAAFVLNNKKIGIGNIADATSSVFAENTDDFGNVRIDVEADTIRQIRNRRKNLEDALRRRIESGQNFSPQELEEWRKQGVSDKEIAEITGDGVMNDVNSPVGELNAGAFGDSRKIGDEVRRAQKIRADEIFAQTRDQYDSPELARTLAEIESAAEVGWIEPGKATEAKQQEIAAYNRIAKENAQITAQVSKNADAGLDKYDPKASAGMAISGTSKVYQPPTLQEIIDRSGSFQGEITRRELELAEAKERDERIRNRSEVSPLYQPLEFAKNFARSFPKGAASVLKSIDIAAEIVSPTNIFDTAIKLYMNQPTATNATQGGFYQIGKKIEELNDKYLPQDEDLKNDKSLRGMLVASGDTLGQVVTQVGLGIATGGVIAPVLFGAAMGGSDQYDEASRAGAGSNQRKLAAIVGGAAAITDAIPFAKILKPLGAIERLGFFGKFLGRIFSDASTEVGEAAAVEVTRGAFRNALVSAWKKSKTLAVNSALEGTQELSEKKINDAVAAMTYDPKRKIFVLNSEDLQEFFGGAIGGAGGGVIEITLESQKRVAPANAYSQELLKVFNFDTPEQNAAEVENLAVKAESNQPPAVRPVSPIVRKQQVETMANLGYSQAQIDTIKQADAQVITENNLLPEDYERLKKLSSDISAKEKESAKNTTQPAGSDEVAGQSTKAETDGIGLGQIDGQTDAPQIKDETTAANNLLSHPNPDLNGKPIIAETSDGKQVVANPKNKSGVSIVKPTAQGLSFGERKDNSQVIEPAATANPESNVKQNGSTVPTAEAGVATENNQQQEIPLTANVFTAKNGKKIKFEDVEDFVIKSNYSILPSQIQRHFSVGYADSIQIVRKIKQMFGDNAVRSGTKNETNTATGTQAEQLKINEGAQGNTAIPSTSVEATDNNKTLPEQTSAETPGKVISQPIAANLSTADIRADGEQTSDGITYRRQAEISETDAPRGKSGTVQFASNKEENFTYRLIEADSLQPSHLGGNRNYNHFLPEAQPKNVSGKDRMRASDEIAKNPQLDKAGVSPNAYFGAPVVNGRGEAIQGNNRSEGFKKHYQMGGTAYKSQLREQAGNFGFTSDQVDALKNPVLVREINVSDDAAIELGNYTATELETGGTQRLNALALSNRLSLTDKAKIVDTVFNTDGEFTLNELIRDRQAALLKTLEPFITNTQRASMIDNRGALKPDAIKDLSDLMKQLLLAGGDLSLPIIFDDLPHKIAQGILVSLPKIFNVPAQSTLIAEIQNAILAFSQFKASDIESFATWATQSDMFSNSAPLDLYTATEMALAKTLNDAQTQKEVRAIFNDYHALVNDRAATMFEPAANGMSKTEAVKELFGVTHNERTDEESNRRSNQTAGETQTPSDEIEQTGNTQNAQSTEPEKRDEPESIIDSDALPASFTHNGITIEIDPMRGLNDRLAAIQDSTIRQFLADPQKWVERYYAEVENGRVDINADNAKLLFDEYNADPMANVAGVHEASSLIAKLVFKIRLQELAPGSTVLLSAGGGASGKTYAINNVLTIDAQLIFDSVMKSEKGNAALINEILDAGHAPHIAAIFMPMDEAAKQNMIRTIKHRRLVPLKVLAGGHFGFQQAFKNSTYQLAKDLGVKISLLKNDGVNPPSDISFEEFKELIYNDLAEVIEIARRAGYSEYETNPKNRQYDPRIPAAYEGETVEPQHTGNASEDGGDAQTSDAGNQGRNRPGEPRSEQINPPVSNETASEQSTSTTKNTKYGASNKVFTKDAAEKAREILRKRLGGSNNQMNTGLDPEITLAGLQLAGYHIEAGAKKFADFAAKMVEDIGTEVKPFLKSFYTSVYFYPGFDNAGMDSPAEIENIKVFEALAEGRKNIAETVEAVDNESQQETGEKDESRDVLPVSEPAADSGTGVQIAGERSDAESGDGVRAAGGVGPIESDQSDSTGEIGDTAEIDAELQTGLGQRTIDTGGESAPIGNRSGGDIRDSVKIVGNFAITDELDFERFSPKQMYRKNVDAIRLLKTLEKENRAATGDEQKILAQFVGWGGLKDALEKNKKGWEKEHAEITGLLTPAELKAAEFSTLNAHYTSKTIVNGIWEGVQRLGFQQGTVLEPSLGSGNFFGLMPGETRMGSRLTAVELDPITSAISRHLYPEAEIYGARGFQEVNIGQNRFDLAIGNPPFDQQTIRDEFNKDLEFNVHGFFFAKSIDALRPGGVLAMVVSRYWMDNNTTGKAARAYVAERAKLLGAIRLPNNAFKSNANTEVVTDIIFLQKLKPREKGNGELWMDTGVLGKDALTGEEIKINKYFADNPQMILGESNLQGKMTAREVEYTVSPTGDLAAQLAVALQGLPENVYRATTGESFIEADDNLKAAPSELHPYSYHFNNDRLHQVFVVERPLTKDEIEYESRTGKRVNNRTTISRDVHDVYKPAQIERLIPITKMRDWIRRIYKAEQNPATLDTTLTTMREALNREYDKFVKKYGFLSSDYNKRVYKNDIANFPLILSLEKNYDRGVSKAIAAKQGIESRAASAEKSDIFFKRTVAPISDAADNIKNPSDALIYSLNQFGKVNIPAMAEILKAPESEVVSALGDAIYLTDKGYVTSDDFLSGDVKTKLENIEKQLEESPGNAELLRQRAALEKVIPADISPYDLTVRINEGWIPKEVHEAFAKHLLGDTGTFNAFFSKASGQWFGGFAGGSETALWDTYGFATKRASKSATDILDALMAGKRPIVTETVSAPTSSNANATKQVVLPDETAAAEQKAVEIEREWESWLYKDETRRDAVVALYNQLYNRTVNRQYNGQHLTLPGKISDEIIKVHPHVKNAIFRAVQSGKTLFNHVVGSGKAQPLSAKLLTPTGWTLMRDIKVGDQVIGRDGLPTTVIGVFPQGEKEIFEVRFSDGARTKCCDEHLWLTSSYRERGYGGRAAKAGKDWECGKPKVRQLSEIRQTLRSSHLNALNHSIPQVEAVCLTEQSLPIAPYLLGVLLGDGNFTQKTVTFTTKDCEIVEKIRTLLPEKLDLLQVNEISWKIRKTEGKSNVMLDNLRELGLQGKKSVDKFIPSEYLFNSIENRLEILRGLMDADGSVGTSGYSTYFYTVSSQLRDGVTFLVQSLGGTVKVSTKTPKFHYNGETRIGQNCYMMCISLPATINPFYIARKRNKVIPKTKYAPIRYITEVVSCGKEQAQCISVENPEKLYVTDDFIVTHNTFTMIGTGMESRRLGLVKKPLYVIPNHLIEQFAGEFMRLYPNANLLVASRKDFVKEKRQELFARIASGDWDGVIVAHSSFAFMQLPAEEERAILDEQKRDLEFAIEEAKTDQDKKLGLKDLQRIAQRVEEKISKLNDRARDNFINFADMGIDGIIVDEAHEFKNLYYTTTRTGVKGMGNPAGSGKAFDMYAKTQYILRKNNNRNVHFATGTPIANSLVEIYNIQRYLQGDTLKKLGLTSLDAWLNTFGEESLDFELNPAGGFTQKNRLAKIKKKPELQTFWNEVVDYVSTEMLIANAEANGERFPLPKFKRHRVVAERSALQSEYIGIPEPVLDENGEEVYDAETGEKQVTFKKGTIVDRLKNWTRNRDEGLTFELNGKVFMRGAGKEIPLAIANHARKAGLDYRLIDETATDDSGSKINLAVNNIFTTYQEWNDRKGTQLVFCDLSVPAKHKGATTAAHKAKMPQFFRQSDGDIRHVDGVAAKLSAMPDREFFTVKKGKNYEIYEKSSGVFLAIGYGGKQAAIDGGNAALASNIEKYRARFEEKKISDEQIENYVAEWLELQEALKQSAALLADEEETNDDSSSPQAISEDELAADEGDSNFSVYDDVRKKLIERGIPANQIAFIHDYNTDLQKQSLFNKMNSGEMRVLIGSTQKMGAGMNVQKRLVALHNLDSPYRPADMEQRVGRIIRQGNDFYKLDPDNFEVNIYDYATSKTYDARMYELIEQKGKSFDQFYARDGARELEDVSPETASYEEMKAEAVGDPRILDSFKMRKALKSLEAQAKVYNNAIYAKKARLLQIVNKKTNEHFRLQDALEIQEGIKEYPLETAQLKFDKSSFAYADITREPQKNQETGKTQPNEAKTKATAGIIARLLKLGFNNEGKIAEYRGVTILGYNNKFDTDKPITLELMFGGERMDKLFFSDTTNINSKSLVNIINKRFDSQSKMVENYTRQVAEIESEVPMLQSSIKEPFKYQQELEETRQKLDALMIALRGSRKTQAVEPENVPTENLDADITETDVAKRIEEDSSADFDSVATLDPAQVIRAAEIKRNGSRLKINLEAQEILRRAWEETKIRAGRLKLGGKIIETPFSGAFYTREQGDQLVKTLKSVEQDARNNGYANEADLVNNIVTEIEAARKEGRGTAVVYMFDKRLPHELFHQASYLGDATRSLQSRHGKAKELDNHPALVKARDNYFSRIGEYKRMPNAARAAIIREEVAAYIAGGEAGVLGLNESEAADYMLNFFDSYAAKNGIESLENFEQENLDVYEVIEKIKTAYAGGESQSNERSGKNLPAEQTQIGSRTTGSDEEASEPADEPATGRERGQKLRSLPNTFRANGLEAHDEYYETFTDADAKSQARKMLDDLGMRGAMDLLRNIPEPDAAHAQLAFLINTELQERANNLEESDPAEARALREIQAGFTRELARKYTKAGQFISAARTVANTATGVVISAQAILQEAHGDEKSLTPEELKHFETLGERSEYAQAQLAEIKKRLKNAQAQIRRMQAEKETKPRRSRSSNFARAKIVDLIKEKHGAKNISVIAKLQSKIKNKSLELLKHIEGSDSTSEAELIRAAFDKAKVTTLKGNEITDFIEPLNMPDLRKKAVSYAKENIVGSYFVAALNGDVEVRRRGVIGTLQHGSAPDKIKSIAAIPDLLREAVLLKTSNDRRGRPMQTHILIAPLDVSGKNYVARLVIREDGNGKLFYDHELSEINNLVALTQASRASEEVGGSGTQRDILILLHKVFSVNKNETVNSEEDSILKRTEESAHDFDQETLSELAEAGAYILSEGIAGNPETFITDQFFAEMTALFGDAIRPAMNEIYYAAMQQRNEWLREIRAEKQSNAVKNSQAIRDQYGDDITDEQVEEILQIRREKSARRRAVEMVHSLVSGFSSRKPTAALRRAIGETATDDNLARAALVLAGGANKTEFYEKMERLGITGKEAEKLLVSGKTALDAAKEKVKNDAAEIQADVIKKSKIIKSIEGELWQARREAQAAQESIANEFQRIKDGNLLYGAKALYGDVVDVFRNLKATGEFSFLLKQGGRFIVGEPVRWMFNVTYGAVSKNSFDANKEAAEYGKVWSSGAKSLWSEQGYGAVMMGIEAHPLFREAVEMGVQFSTAGKVGTGEKSGEEQLNAGLIEKLATKSNYWILPAYAKLIGRFDASMAGTMDALRMMMYDRMATQLRKEGFDPKKNKSEFVAIARDVTRGTGRANKFENAKGVQKIIDGITATKLPFATSYTVSHFQVLGADAKNIGSAAYRLVVYRSLPKGAQKAMLSRAIYSYGSTAVFYTLLAYALGGVVSFDPDDDDFLKIKVGKYRYDASFGLRGEVRFIAKMLRDAYQGNRVPNERVYDFVQNVTKYSRNKLNVVPAFAWDALTGKDVMGQPVSLSDWKIWFKLIYPITYGNIPQAYSQDGLASVALTLPPEFLGIGSNVYPDRPEEPRTEAEKLALKMKQMSKGWFSSRDDVTISPEIWQKVGDLKKRSRDGENVSSEVGELQKSGALPESVAKTILEAKGQTYFEEMVKSGRFSDQQIEALSKYANDDEKAVLDRLKSERGENKAKKETNAAQKEAVRSAILEMQKLPKENRAKIMNERINEMIKAGRIDKRDGEMIRAGVAQNKSIAILEMDVARDPDKIIEIFEEAIKTATGEEKQKLINRLKEKKDKSKSPENQAKYEAVLKLHSKPIYQGRESGNLIDMRKLLKRPMEAAR